MTDALTPKRIANVVQSCHKQLSGNVSCLFSSDSETILALIDENKKLFAVAVAAESVISAYEACNFVQEDDLPILIDALDAWKAGGK